MHIEKGIHYQAGWLINSPAALEIRTRFGERVDKCPYANCWSPVTGQLQAK